MGSIVGGLLGGGSKNSGGGTQVSGYAALPAQLRSIFDALGSAVGQYTNPNNPGVTSMFTPMQQTADETAAIEKTRQGFAPTAQSIQSDIAMQQNPFNQYVIDAINREANGQNSILKQNLSKVGQFGSNRGMLGANDIDLSRLQQIGQFQQGQFNNALNNAINVLPNQRASDAASLMGIGNFQRNLDFQTKQAPISALTTGTSMISPFTAGETVTTNPNNNGMLGNLGGLVGGLGTAWKAFGFSDIRLKENIIPIGQENGYNIYEFSYKGNPQRYVGVVAQEVELINPYAVIQTPYGLAVDYDKIGVKFREVA